MKFPPLRLLACALLAHAVHAQLPQPAGAADFKPLGANWQIAGGLSGDPRHDKILTALPGSGLLVNNPTKDARAHLVTAWDHGDLSLDLDFLLNPGSNSGVYLMGRYEVQLFDSWGVTKPTTTDCGAIYDRWDAARGKGKEGYDGTAPLANASRAPGLWQHLHIEFRAPRFDAAGKKTANAKFLRVVLNDFLIHENVEISGPTRSALFENDPEAARGPLVIQGDHGAVALRQIVAQRLDSAPITVTDLAYQLFTAEQKPMLDPTAKPSASGPLTRFSVNAVEKSGKFALVITGTLTVPAAGAYTLTPDTRGQARLVIDDQVALAPLERGAEASTLTLTAGAHPFRLDYVQVGGAKPGITLTAVGPGLAPQVITSPDPGTRPPAKPKHILIAPAERTRLQRSFVPYQPKKRLYAINVGTPAGLHFSYDFETGAILRVWRGEFLDAEEMWDGRGEPQTARAAGPELLLNAKPVVALIENSAQGWPDAPEALWSSQGYTLAADGIPTFLAKLASLDIKDTITPGFEGRGLTRTLALSGRNTSWETNILLAEADTFTPQPGGRGFIVGDREYYVDLPAGGAVTPFVRTRNGRQQLVVTLTGGKVDRSLTYSLVW